jgi:hypothetical protein
MKQALRLLEYLREVEFCWFLLPLRVERGGVHRNLATWRKGAAEKDSYTVLQSDLSTPVAMRSLLKIA